MYNSEIDNLIPLVELVNQLGIVGKKKTVSKEQFMPITFLKLEQLYVDEKYQRLLNETMIKSAKEFNSDLCRPLFVYKRPDGKYAIVDGQHTAAIATIYCENDDNLFIPCQVKEHNPNSTVEECIVRESLTFKKLNECRTNVSVVEKLRSDIAAGDKKALEIEEQLNDLGVHVEKIGNPSGEAVVGYAKLMESIVKYKISNTKKAIRLYSKLNDSFNAPKWVKPMQGSMILGLAAVYYLIDTELGDKKTEGVLAYLNEHLRKLSPKEWMYKTAGLSQDILIVRKIISDYNSAVRLEVINAPTIGEKTLENAGFGDLGITKRNHGIDDFEDE